MSREPASTSIAAESTFDSLHERGRCSVRFDNQCVVIPEPAPRSRMPKVGTKSYALPLWKRRASDSGLSTSLPEDTSSDEHNHLVLRVPLPTFSLKPQLAHRCSDYALTPCLVHRTPAPPSQLTTSRSPSLTRRTPRKCSPSPSRADVVTVPLRPCCAACQAAADAALTDGDAWSEHFSRAASRRRSASADSSPRTVMGSYAATFYEGLGHPVAISVDEVDKRRRSSDTGPPSSVQELVWLNDARAKEDIVVPLLHVSRDGVSNSTSSLPSPTRLTPSTPRIPEEDDEDDENELFPLPSPRRTPTTSPAGSLSSLTVSQSHQNSTNSPTPSNGSADLTQAQKAPPCASSSSLSLPKTSESTTDLSTNSEVLRSPSPDLLSSLPSISGRMQTKSSSPRISRTPATPIDLSPTSSLPEIPRIPSPINIPSPNSSLHLPSSPSPQTSPTQSRFSWRSKRSVSTESSLSSPSPSTPPNNLSTSPHSKKRTSFAITAPRHIIADIIRGVGAMGPGPGSAGINFGR